MWNFLTYQIFVEIFQQSNFFLKFSDIGCLCGTFYKTANFCGNIHPKLIFVEIFQQKKVLYTLSNKVKCWGNLSTRWSSVKTFRKNVEMLPTNKIIVEIFKQKNFWWKFIKRCKYLCNFSIKAAYFLCVEICKQNSLTLGIRARAVWRVLDNLQALILQGHRISFRHSPSQCFDLENNRFTDFFNIHWMTVRPAT